MIVLYIKVFEKFSDEFN